MPLKLPRAILLDLDGTLVALGSSRIEYWNTVTRLYHAELGSVRPSALSSEIIRVGDLFWAETGKNKKWRLHLREARRQIVEKACSNLNLLDSKLAFRIADSFSDLRERGENMISVVPGSVETVRFLRDSGVSLALLTNGSSRCQRDKIERFELEQFFDQILIEEEIGLGKPDELIYQEALDRLEISARDAWIVGDNPLWDIVIPQRLGIKGVWINNREMRAPANMKPFLTVKSFPEIRDHLVGETMPL